MTETSAALLTAVVTATPEIAALVAPDGEMAWINPAFVTRWPCAQTPTVEGLLDVVDPADHPAVEAAYEEVRSGTTRSVVRRAKLGCTHARRDGRVRLTRVETGDAAGSVVIHVEEVDGVGLSYAGIDPLTGLADRAGMLAQLDICLSSETDAHLAVFDLDHFHLVNESLGYATGDDVLIRIARRIHGAVHQDDVVARISGDKFAVLCAHDDQLEAMVEAVRREINAPIALGTGGHVIDTSVGLVSLELVTGAIDALAAADSAVYLAKARGRGRTETFDTGMRKTALHTLRRTSELRQAADNDEFILRYQPIVDLGTGSTVGCEALLRWQHPELGELSAGEFIEIAEASGLVHHLTDSLLTEACDAVRRMSTHGRAPYISVNLSPRQLIDPNLLHRIDEALERAEIDPQQLMVEITENTMLVDVETSVAALSGLRERGIRVALDDFGTGFSNLLRLRELPVDCLKIDRAFVAELTRNPDDLAIVASVVNMASTLNLQCIAEGVETEEQAEQLRRLGCSTAQGYLWSPAVPLEEVPVRPGVRRRRPSRQAIALEPATEAWIMRLHASGASLSSIAAVLNASGARTLRGTRWHPRTVARVVAHAAYPQLVD